MTGQKVLHGLRDGELDIHQAAVAQHDDKEAQASTRLSHGHRAVGAPIDLGTLAGSKGECEKSGLAFGAHRAYIGFDDRVAAIKALLAQALPDLGSAIGVLVQHLGNLGLERSEFAGPWWCLAGSEALLAEPVGHSTRIERQGGRNLRGLESMVFMQGL